MACDGATVSCGGNHLGEAVSVELPHEGGEVVVLKVEWQQLLCKCLWVKNNESVAGLCPSNDVVRLFLIHHLVQLRQERLGLPRGDRRGALHTATAQSPRRRQGAPPPGSGKRG
eukprot:scaffold2662_cov115-Isochrysis_galbana.AAC.2